VENKIVWQKWEDPMLNKSNIIPFNMNQFLPKENDDPYDPIQDFEDDPKDIDLSHIEAIRPDFWIINTNFDITKNVFEAIYAIPGVETLEVLTRYRARIGFPKSGLFEPRETINNINKSLCCDNLPLECSDNDIILSRTAKIKKKINKYKHWTMWILPNGNIEAVCSNEKNEEYLRKSAVLMYGKEFVGGLFFTEER